MPEAEFAVAASVHESLRKLKGMHAWFLTGVTAPALTQSTSSEATASPCEKAVFCVALQDMPCLNRKSRATGSMVKTPPERPVDREQAQARRTELVPGQVGIAVERKLRGGRAGLRQNSELFRTITEITCLEGVLP